MATSQQVIVNKTTSETMYFGQNADFNNARPKSTSDLTGMHRMHPDATEYNLSSSSGQYLVVGTQPDASGNMSGVTFDFNKFAAQYAKLDNYNQSLNIQICDNYDPSSQTFTMNVTQYGSSGPTGNTSSTVTVGDQITVSNVFIYLPKYSTLPMVSSTFGIVLSNTGSMVIGCADANGKLMISTPNPGVVLYPTVSLPVSKTWLYIVLLIIILLVVIAVIYGVVHYKKVKYPSS